MASRAAVQGLWGRGGEQKGKPRGIRARWQVEAAVGKSKMGTAQARKMTGMSAKGCGREGDSADEGDDVGEKGVGERVNGQR